MTSPSEPESEQPDSEPEHPTKRDVLWRRGDGLFTDDEHVQADVEAADHWDDRNWGR